MEKTFFDTSLVDKAIKFAVDAHANVERRGKGFPYVVHVLEAMEIVATITNEPELLAAAVLHDTVEDTNTTIADIRNQFGERVAKLVELESDKGISCQDNLDWKSRKEAAINRLANAPYEAKIVALGDKLSNMRAIARDYKKVGDKLWDIFHAPNGRSDHEWHYRGLVNSLSDLAGTEAYTEFVNHITDVFGDAKPELIDLNDYEESGGGYNGISFNHKDGKRMMKLYETHVSYDDIEREYKVSQEIKKLGVQIPIAYRMVTDGRRTGVEFERITPKRSFARAISQEPQNLEKYAILFAKKCKELHETQCNTQFFVSAADYYIDVVNKTKIFNDEEKLKVIEYIKSIPLGTTCIHGDMHIGNIITDEQKIYWIDLADFKYGNPIFDFGVFYLVCNCNTEEMTQHLYHITNAQVHKMWGIFLREYFGPDIDIEAFNKQCESIAALVRINYDNKGIMHTDRREEIRKTLLQ